MVAIEATFVDNCLLLCQSCAAVLIITSCCYWNAHGSCFGPLLFHPQILAWCFSSIRFPTSSWLGSENPISQMAGEAEGYRSKPLAVALLLSFSTKWKWMEKYAFGVRLYFTCCLLCGSYFSRLCGTVPCTLCIFNLFTEKRNSSRVCPVAQHWKVIMVIMAGPKSWKACKLGWLRARRKWVCWSTRRWKSDPTERACRFAWSMPSLIRCSLGRTLFGALSVLCIFHLIRR